MPDEAVGNFGRHPHRVFKQRRHRNRDALAHRLAEPRIAQVVRMILALDFSQLAGMPTGSDRADDFHYLAQMRDRFARGDAMHVFIETADAGAEAQHRAPAADGVEIERVQRRFDRTAGEGERDATADMKGHLFI